MGYSGIILENVLSSEFKRVLKRCFSCEFLGDFNSLGEFLGEIWTVSKGDYLKEPRLLEGPVLPARGIRKAGDKNYEAASGAFFILL